MYGRNEVMLVILQLLAFYVDLGAMECISYVEFNSKRMEAHPYPQINKRALQAFHSLLFN